MEESESPSLEKAPPNLQRVLETGHIEVAISQQELAMVDDAGTVQPFWVRLFVAGPPQPGINPEEALDVAVSVLSNKIKAAIEKHRASMAPPSMQEREEW